MNCIFGHAHLRVTVSSVQLRPIQSVSHLRPPVGRNALVLVVKCVYIRRFHRNYYLILIIRLRVRVLETRSELALIMDKKLVSINVIHLTVF